MVRFHARFTFTKCLWGFVSEGNTHSLTEAAFRFSKIAIVLSSKGTVSESPFLVSGTRQSLCSQLISSQRIIKAFVFLTPVNRSIQKRSRAVSFNSLARDLTRNGISSGRINRSLLFYLCLLIFAVGLIPSLPHSIAVLYIVFKRSISRVACYKRFSS